MRQPLVSASNAQFALLMSSVFLSRVTDTLSVLIKKKKNDCVLFNNVSDQLQKPQGMTSPAEFMAMQRLVFE